MSIATIYTTGDTFIRQDEGSTNKNGETYMALGKTGSSSQVDRILMAFNLNSVQNKIINSATLYMYQDYSTFATSTALPFSAHCISGSWAAGTATWNTQPSFDATNGVVNLSQSGNADGQRSYDVSSLIQDIIHNDRSYYGILLKQTNESTSDLRKNYFTEEYSSGSRQPYLSVDYTEPGFRVNAGGTWQHGIPYVNDGGTWKQAQAYGNVGGAWKQGI